MLGGDQERARVFVGRAGAHIEIIIRRDVVGDRRDGCVGGETDLLGDHHVVGDGGDARDQVGVRRAGDLGGRAIEGGDERVREVFQCRRRD